MQKLEAVAIPMEEIEKEIDFLVGKMPISVEKLINQHSFEIFSNEVLNFLTDISASLLKNPQTKKYPDVATFAFYCRKANINSIKRNYIKKDDNPRLGRGIIFHITPSNVPVNFAYSLFTGLVTGNINIVKVPSEHFEQIDIIIHSIKEVLEQKKHSLIFSKRLFIVRYNREGNVTSWFSKICDVRIIWGGDNTINDVRKSSIPPRSNEITFSDRYSISIINASNFLKTDNLKKIALGFFNDTYLFDQNACTSPQTIYWLGSASEVQKAKTIFWDMIQKILNEKNYEMQPILSVDKLTTFYDQAIAYGNISREGSESNKIWRIKNSSLNNDIELFRCSSGYFNENIIVSLDDILGIVNRKYQTVGYIGFTRDELKSWIEKNRPIGFDRFVPIGRTMDFSLKWDGYDLVDSLSRHIQII